MAEKRLQEIRKIRLEKVRKLRELRIDPYPSKIKGSPQPVSLVRDHDGEEVGVAGRIVGWREHGNVIFADLKDETATIQLWFQKNSLNDQFTLLKYFDMGDFIYVKGLITKTKAGEVTIDVYNFQILTKSIRPLPSSWHGLRDVEERYRKRYVDLLLNEEVRKVFDKRTKIVKEIRSFMDSHGFVEVETPILQPIYGGANAQPFITHHNALDVDLYLRISNELYLKRLIVGGFEKVYEMGRVFRNEGIDRAHNPEFTMLEFYWAYADYEKLMRFSEDLLSEVINKVNGSLMVKYEEDDLDFTPPWPRKTYRELLIEGVGIDIDIADDEEKLKGEIKDKNLKFDFQRVVGYGALCDKLYKEFIRPRITQPTLVLDYPAAMIALAKRKEDPRKIASFQLLVKGHELIKAYNELNDPIDQRERWLEEEKLGEEGLEEHMVLDEDYIRALEYGMPPTAGWGLGIDRLTAILTNRHSLKEVILFPTLRPEGSVDKSEKSTLGKLASKSKVGLGKISKEVKTKFPGISFAYTLIEGVEIKKQNKELEQLKEKILDSRKDLTIEEIRKILSIKVYREMLKETGVDVGSRMPSPEALLKRIVNGKGIYNINTAVDAYNLAVVETGIGLGGFDFAKVSAPVELRFSKEGEVMQLLGESGSTFTKEGELVYADTEKLLTLDLNYRDIDETKITLDTKTIILFADGGPGIDWKGLQNALELGAGYIRKFCGGRVHKLVSVE